MQPGSLAFHHEHVYTPLPKAEKSGSSEQGADGGGGGPAGGVGGGGSGIGGVGGDGGAGAGEDGDGGSGGTAPMEKSTVVSEPPPTSLGSDATSQTVPLAGASSMVSALPSLQPSPYVSTSVTV